MSSSQHQGGPNRVGAEVPTAPGPLLDALRQGFTLRLLPSVAEAQHAAEAELRKLRDAGPLSDELAEALANLTVLGSHASEYERRWQRHIGDAFADWPQPPPKLASDDAYALVSEEELQAQLVGQPLIEAMDRRFHDILDVIDRRLWSLAIKLDSQARPSNPLAPRIVVNAFLDSFPPSECDPPLRAMLLRQYERVASKHLTGIYAWCNTMLSQGGLDLTSTGGHAMSFASTAALVEPSARGAWSAADRLPPGESGSQKPRHGAGSGKPDTAGVSGRGALLRELMLQQRGDDRDDPQDMRELGDMEFFAVLSLLHWDEAATSRAGNDIAGFLRQSMQAGAGQLGMHPDQTRPSPAQETAIDLVGQLLDRLLQDYQLREAATALLAGLAPAFLHLAMSDPALFDEPGHPAMQLLSKLVENWDCNRGEDDTDAELLALADATATALIENYPGDEAAFVHALDDIRAALEPHRRRAEIAERRVVQSLQGRERLQLARIEADRRLHQQLHGRPLLATVADFLGEQWRQSLVQGWLKHGPESQHFAEAVKVGEQIARLDDDAAHARGHALAEGLLALQDPLRQCYVACGLDESGANMLLAQLVSELAQPDAARRVHGYTPLAGSDDPGTQSGSGDAESPDLKPGQAFAHTAAGKPPQWLKLAWQSQVSGACLLVDRRGARQLLLLPGQLREMLAAGSLAMRSPHGPVEGVLRTLAGQDGQDR